MKDRISTAVGVACASSVCIALTNSAFAGGGDDPSNATMIDSLPFTDTGDTSALTNQFDVVCPTSGSTSPDAWFSYTAEEGDLIRVALCDSAYNTKVYVLDSNFADVACNDDACGGTNRSSVITPALVAGTYFIVVDGAGGDAGTYDLLVEGVEPCVTECPAGSAAEGEVCDEAADDTTNGGCNSDTFVISDVACGDTVCGVAWAGNGTRDTDWYRLAPSALGGVDSITYTATAGFNAAVFYLGENPDCGTIAVVTAANTAACGETSTISENVDSASETWWFMGKADFDLLPCGATGASTGDYIISWSCADDPLLTPCPALGDTNGDGVVDFNDLLTVLANFGPCP